jgi:FXSXX-COOH protein
MRDEVEFGGQLVELSGFSLQEIGDLDDSPLGAELREVLADAGNGHGITAGFQARI